MFKSENESSCRGLAWGFSIDPIDRPLKEIMRTTIPEKLLAIAAEVKEQGSANLTRLTVLKKWFQKAPSPFLICNLHSQTGQRTEGKKHWKTGQLFRDARALMKGANVFRPEVSHEKAEKLHSLLHVFQNEHKRLRWGTARIIKNHNFVLVEEGLRIYLLVFKLTPRGLSPRCKLL